MPDVVPGNSDLYRRDHENRTKYRARIYALLVFYLVVVCLNALSIVIAFWLRVTNKIDISYEVLGAWAIGAGGLGAGSLAFNGVIKYLFESN
jgi:hypothetical protein